MGQHNTADIAIKFIEKLNRRDFDGLSAYMSVDHKAIDESGGVTDGKQSAVKVISGYIKDRPNFQIHVNDVYVKGDEVMVVGRTTGSCTETSYDVEIKEKLVYRFKVEDDLISEFQYALKFDDNARRDLGFDSATKITD